MGAERIPNARDREMKALDTVELNLINRMRLLNIVLKTVTHPIPSIREMGL